MKISNSDKQKIFEFAKHELDNKIEQNGFFDDNNISDLEDLILDTTTTYFMAEHKQKIDFTNFENYDQIIDLTEDFLTWLFDSGEYDKEFYKKMAIIRRI